jgi:hypothetical protein
MPSKKRPPIPGDHAPMAADCPVQRDGSNFDFRLIPLFAALVARNDLLDEYITDGKEKKGNVPVAVSDPKRWPHLRQWFDPDMLGQLLYLFELKETQRAADQLRLAFETAVALFEYCPDLCPDDEFLQAATLYSHQQSDELRPAGIADDLGR